MLLPCPQIIYAHGFGGRDHASPFFVALSAACKRQQLRADLRPFAWDSLPLTPEALIANFLTSQQHAATAGAALHAQIMKLEADGTPYHLIGYSLGAEVLRQALHHQQTALAQLQSVYLLGAAFNHAAPINVAAIPAHARCHNYYSAADVVLRVSYANVAGVAAAGSSGISSMQRFENLRTHCTHVLAFNYTLLADAITSLIAWDTGAIQLGEPRFNSALPTLGGAQLWNAICRVSGHVVQQHPTTRHYRALSEGHGQRRVAWGPGLHGVLRALGEQQH